MRWYDIILWFITLLQQKNIGTKNSFLAKKMFVENHRCFLFLPERIFQKKLQWWWRNVFISPKPPAITMHYCLQEKLKRWDVNFLKDLLFSSNWMQPDNNGIGKAYMTFWLKLLGKQAARLEVPSFYYSMIICITISWKKTMSACLLHDVINLLNITLNLSKTKNIWKLYVRTY